MAGTLPAATTNSITVRYEITATNMKVSWAANGGAFTQMVNAALSLDPTAPVGIILISGSNWFIGPSCWDIAVDNVSVTSADLPQCARDSLLPVAGLAGLAVLAASLAGGAAAIIRRKK